MVLQTTGHHDDSVPGAFHVHTNRSDGRGTPDEIARAAAAAGLRFVVFTDHGDGTRAPDPPAYRAGVLCLDGVEISTADGHYVALGLPATPYPLGGEARDVVEDVRRLGGFGVAAHPDSPKADLQWRGWPTPIDGIELLNLDTSWRVRAAQPGWMPKLRLLAALGGYAARPEATIASLTGDAPDLVKRFDALARDRRIIAIAGADAHAKLALRDVEPGDSRFSLPLPGYETVFRTLSIRVRPDGPLSGDAGRDADAILGAVRRGHLYAVVDGLASPPAFSFTAHNERGRAREGDDLAAGGPVTLRLESNAPPGYAAAILEDGEPLAAGPRSAGMTVTTAGRPAVYRAEIRAVDRPDQSPWIIANPIRVGLPDSAPPADPPGPAWELFPLVSGTLRGWTVEHDPSSTVALAVEGGGAIRMEYALAVTGDGAVPKDQRLPRPYAAANAPVLRPPFLPSRLALVLRAERPMRLSVQLRSHVEHTQERWYRSVYADQGERRYEVPIDQMTPTAGSRPWRTALPDINALLFVVDATHARPGSSGRVWIRNAAFER